MKKKLLIDRDLAWLEFNRRVLKEAEDPTVPLLERVKFLEILSSNLDEFFMVRVAGLKRRLNNKLESAELDNNDKALVVSLNSTSDHDLTGEEHQRYLKT